MNKRDDLMMQEARKLMSSMSFTALETHANTIMTGGEFTDPGHPNYEVAKATYVACVERQLELKGIDPYVDSAVADTGPTPQERVAKLREQGYDTQADLLEAGIENADHGDGRNDTEKAQAAAVAVNLEINAQIQKRNEDVAARDKE